MSTSADNQRRAIRIIELMRIATKTFTEPASTSIVKKYGKNPYLILISCILSLRTKDSTSLAASLRLFEHAQTPEKMLTLSSTTIEQLIYPTGFYRQKTQQIKKLSALLLKNFNGTVPHTEQELLTLPGVGRKTTNLLLSVAFDIPALCVDTHVHRISNRLGLVSTQTPEKTEKELKKILPPQYWREYSSLMVMWGQNICVPISPRCSICPLLPLCPQNGVTQHR